MHIIKAVSKISVISLLTAFLLSPALAATGEKPGVTFNWENIPKFTHKGAMVAQYKGHYNAARSKIIEANQDGHDLPCSSQILREVGWLMKYTQDHKTIEKRLVDLDKSLKVTPDAQAYAGKQVESDGSWGACYDSWFFRAWSSVDPLKGMVYAKQKPEYELKFLEEVNTPEKLIAKVRNAQTSHVSKDGMNRRKELNLLVTAIGQLLFLPELRVVLPEGFPRQELSDALIKFMDDEWQDPKTGFWGAWYQEGDRTVKTEDLSITFHIVSYRKGDVKRHDELLHTLFEIRERKYPYGWQDRGTQNTHHNYDVARLILLFWDELDDIQRARSQAELTIMASRIGRVSLRDDGYFDPTPFSSVGEAQYFGVSFLSEIGYFDPKKNTWLNHFDFDPDNQMQDQLIKNMEKLDQSDWWVVMTLKKLRGH